VDHFQSAGALEQAFRRSAESFADRQQQCGTKTLTAGKQAPTDGFVNRSRVTRLRRNQSVQFSINSRPALTEEILQIALRLGG